MDLNQEVTNHLQWIESLAAILGTDELTYEYLQRVTQHDKCALGKWLDSDEPGELKKRDEFELLIDSHDAFHRLAGDLITAAQQNKEADALELQAMFIEESKKVIGYLQSLQESVK